MINLFDKKLIEAIKWLGWVLFFVFLLCSCGARKVDKTEKETETKKEVTEVVKTDVKATENTNVKEVVETDVKDEETTETITYTPIDETKPAIFINEGKEVILNNTSFIKTKTKRNKQSKIKDSVTASQNKEVADSTLKTTTAKEVAKATESEKYIDKKQFDIIAMIISYWWLWLILIILLYLFKKYRNLIWWV